MIWSRYNVIYDQKHAKMSNQGIHKNYSAVSKQPMASLHSKNLDRAKEH